MSKARDDNASDQPEFQIVPLTPEHNLDDFDCGETSLNEYLIKFGRWNASVGIGKTYVVVREQDSRVLGYYTIAVGHLRTSDLPEQVAKRLPRYPVPVIKVGRLACNLSTQRMGLGGALLMDALLRAALIADQVAVFAVEVDALNEKAQQFYERYGFQSLLDDPMHMYLPMRKIQKLR